MIGRAIVVAACVFAVSPAIADSPAGESTEARKYFEAGKQAYKAGQFRDAAHAFDRAYELAPRPSTMFSLAQALRRQYFVDREPRDLKRSLELFKQYLREYPDGNRRGHAVEHIADLEPMWDKLSATLDTEQRKAADRRVAQPTQLLISSQTPGARAAVGSGELAPIPVTATVEPGTHRVRLEAPGYHAGAVNATAVEGRLVVVRLDLEPKAARLAVAGPPGALVTIDGRTPGTLPLGAPVEITAGEHFIAVTKRGHEPYGEVMELGNGERRDIDVRLRQTGRRRASYWVMGGAGVLLLAGGVTTGIAWKAQSDAQDITDGSRAEMRALTPDEGAEHTDLLDRRDRFRNISYALGGGAIVAGGIGVLMWLLDHPQPTDPRSQVRVAPGPTPAGAGVAVSF